MMYYILTQDQANTIQAYIDATYVDGDLNPYWTIKVGAGRLEDGNLACAENLTEELEAEGFPDWETTLDGLGIDIDTLPLRTVNPNEWYKPID